MDEILAALPSVPGVASVVADENILAVTLEDGRVAVGFSRAPGWLSLAVQLHTDPDAGACRRAFSQGKALGRLRPLLADGDLWLRADALGAQGLPGAVAALLGRPLVCEVDAAALVEASRYDADFHEGLGGWQVTDPQHPQGWPMITWADQGGFHVYRPLQQLSEPLDDDRIAGLLRLNDALAAGRVVMSEGLGLVVYALLPVESAAQLDTALAQVQADAERVAGALRDPVDDPRAMLALLRDAVGRLGISGPLLAQGVLAAAAGQPLPEALPADELVPSILAGLAEILLETIPSRARSGRLVMQIGLTGAASGERPIEELWEVAAAYLRETS